MGANQRYRDEYNEFLGYCRTLTNAQVLAVVEKEREGSERDEDRIPHLEAAKHEARNRRIA